jgi:amino acid adenylation domain-containing protein
VIASTGPARDTAPLSFPQEQLWLEEQLSPRSARYVMPAAVEIRGPLDIPVLHRAFRAVLLRHDALRTSIRSLDGAPVQQVDPSPHFSIPLIDAAALSPGASYAVRRRLATWNERCPFDLGSAPLLRATLLRTGSEMHVLYTALHHIVADGWSLGILVRELAACYEAFSSGHVSAVTEVPGNYADYAVSQRDRLRGPRLHELLAFWTQRLAGAAPTRELWGTPDLAGSRTDGSGRVSRQLEPALAARIAAFSRDRRVTPFSVYLGALVTLLSRKLGDPDVLAGVVTAGRTAAEWEQIIGLFANVLLIRTRLDDARSFGEVVESVHREWMEVQAHQDLPFELLVERLNPPRRPDRAPFFDVLINFGDVPRGSLKAAGLQFEMVEAGVPESKFPLTVYLQPGDAPRLCFAYRARDFSAASIEAFADQYEALLDRAMADSSAPIGGLSLMTAAARRVLPDPAAPLREPAQEPVAVLLTRAADAFADRLAFAGGGTYFSYRDWIAAARPVAAQLVTSHGITPGVPVALCMEPGAVLFVHTLGVLLCGGTLVMLDPFLPVARLQNVVSAAGCHLLVTDRALPPMGCEIIPPLLSHNHTDVTLPEIDPAAPAYVFFTSGTTGTPKGIRGVQKGLSHFLCWQRDQFAIGPEHRFAQLTAPGFDVVLRDVLLPWICGAALLAPSTAERSDPALLLDWLRRERITALHAVPSLAAQWLSASAGIPNEHLRFAFFAGEPLTGSLVRRWRDAFPACRVINLYGPTETTLAKAWYDVPAGCREDVQPVGRPLPNTQLLALNRAQRLCGIDEPGEIVIRTPFRTLGYLDEEQTRRRFVPNPVTKSARDVVYFTGDRGRYRPDGALEILGRNDRQVKINGVRIELDEVAAELRAIPGVQNCEVSVHESGEDAQLVAFATGAGLGEAGLHRLLSRRLPPSSVPSRIIVLDRMPLLPNGKVDRRSLSTMEVAPPCGATCERDSTPVEAEVAVMWAEILNRRPAPSDHFFLSGGHSMQAARLIAAINHRFRTSLTLRDIFEHPTLAELAAAVQASGDADALEVAGAAGAVAPLLTLRQGTDGVPTVCVHPGSGLAGCYHALTAFLPAGHPVYGLQADWTGDGLGPYRRIQSISALYIDRLRVHGIPARMVLAGWSSGGLVAFEMAAQLTAAGQPPAALILLDSGLPAGGPGPASARDAHFLAGRFHGLSGLTETQIADTPEDRRFGRILAALQSARMLPAAVTEPSFAAYCDFLFTFAAARLAYRPPAYPGSVLLIRAAQGDPAGESAFAAWKPIAPALRTCTVPGTHYEMMREPAVSQIARHIAEAARGVA